MNKKGQGLPMNVVIMAILVIVVLVLVVTFFFGGFSGLTLKIKEVFFGGMVGTEETLAIQACERFCDNLQLRSYSSTLDAQEVTEELSFCKSRRPVDLDGDGEIKGDKEKKVSCKTLRVSCVVTTEIGEKVPVTCE